MRVVVIVLGDGHDAWAQGSRSMRGDRHTGNAPSGVLGTAMLACLVAALLVSTVAVVSAARTIEIGPRVGDILVFRQGARMPPDWAFTVAAAPAPSVTCSLRPAAMASQGGSIVVEQRSPPTFQVHWAGGRTSDAGADCGSDAALLVASSDLQLLTNVVGGAGVEHKAFPYL
jgi:hypothetical protein